MTAAAVSQLQQKLPNIKAPKRLISDAQYFNSVTKNETLVRQLGSSSVVAKLEAMKKIVAQLSKGKDVSDLFADVVKNVACQSLEVKKLVYLYVMHYAEEKHDLALLSIAHFQKDMTDKSQHVRALSLRVLSSIRVPIIVQIVLLAIRKCISDPSPWVRKAASIAIPKIYRLNQEEKPQLVSLIDQLLGDNSPTVHGAAAHAYTVVCPENVEIMHKHYRKLVRGMAQVDEWGQTVLLEALLRYGRTQFLSPFKQGYKKRVNFYGSEESKDSESSSEEDSEDLVEVQMDEDHRMLLDHALSLLHSANHAVVINVASLFFHLAPPHEFSGTVAKALLRIVRGTREQQYIALVSMHTFASQRPAAFRPFIKSFFVTPADPVFTQKLKIDILALLADSTNVTTVLREFKVYLHNAPEELLVRTVRALGRVAYFNSDVSETCLATLAELTSHPNVIVVGESVVVTRHLLQKIRDGHGKIIVRLAKLLPSMELPLARSSIVWLVGEYLKVAQVAQCAPDTYRLLLKGFTGEDTSVKQQVILLGSKLMIHDYDESVKDRVEKLFNHMMHLTKFDASYTLRDRARLSRSFLTDEKLQEHAKRVFVTEKKETDLSDPGEDRQRFLTGSLSHMLNCAVVGYQPLPPFPTEQPDVTLRDNALLSSDSESDSDSDSDDSDKEDSSFFGSGDSDSDSDSDSDDSDDESSDPPPPKKGKGKGKKEAPSKAQASKKSAPAKKKKAVVVESSDSDTEETESSSSDTESTEPEPVPKKKKKAAKPAAKASTQFMDSFSTAEAGGASAGAKATEESQDPLAGAWDFGLKDTDAAEKAEKPVKQAEPEPEKEVEVAAAAAEETPKPAASAAEPEVADEEEEDSEQQ